MPDIGTESLDAAISREIAAKRRGVGGAVASDIEGASTAWIPDGEVATAQRGVGCEPQAGADVNAKVVSGAKQGLTPLDAANETKHPEIADLLRKHGGKTGEELEAEQK